MTRDENFAVLCQFPVANLYQLHECILIDLNDGEEVPFLCYPSVPGIKELVTWTGTAVEPTEKHI